MGVGQNCFCRIGFSEWLCTVSRICLSGLIWGGKMAKIDQKPDDLKEISLLLKRVSKKSPPVCSTIQAPYRLCFQKNYVQFSCQFSTSSVTKECVKNTCKWMSSMLEGSSAICAQDRHQVWQGGRYLYCALVSVDLKELVTVHFSKTCF